VIFIDSGAFLARTIKRDQYHGEAVAFWKRLQGTRERCFTSSFVLSETFTLLGRRAGYEFAAERARNIYASERLTLLRPAREDEIEAIELLGKFADQKVSFTDCVSFVLMRRNRLKRVFSFDSHFERAGFERHP